MEGFFVKTTDIRFVKDSHLFVKDYFFSVAIFETNELQHLRGSKRTHFFLEICVYSFKHTFPLVESQTVHYNRVAR